MVGSDEVGDERGKPLGNQTSNRAFLDVSCNVFVKICYIGISKNHQGCFFLFLWVNSFVCQLFAFPEINRALARQLLPLGVPVCHP